MTFIGSLGATQNKIDFDTQIWERPEPYKIEGWLMQWGYCTE